MALAEGRAGAVELRPRPERCVLAHLAERDAAEDALRDLREYPGRVGRERDVEALRELGEPRELVGARRHDGAPQALEATLEIHHRPVALEVARRRKDEIRPAGRETVE